MIEVIVANVPMRKMQRRAIFSRVGLLILISVLTGRPRMKISVAMLKADVTAHD
jgi:hypothetical protein